MFFETVLFLWWDDKDTKPLLTNVWWFLGNLIPILTYSDFSSDSFAISKKFKKIKLMEMIWIWGWLLPRASGRYVGVEITGHNHIFSAARDDCFLKKACKNDYPWGCLANAEKDYTITQDKEMAELGRTTNCRELRDQKQMKSGRTSETNKPVKNIFVRMSLTWAVRLLSFS